MGKILASKMIKLLLMNQSGGGTNLQDYIKDIYDIVRLKRP